MTTTTETAIDRSAAQNEIVHLPWTQETEEELLAACDDSAESGSVQEYWGTTDAGHEWRVHLDREVAS